MTLLRTNHCSGFVAKRVVVAFFAILSMCALTGSLLGDDWKRPRRNLSLIDCDRSNAKNMDGADTNFPRRPGAFIATTADEMAFLKLGVRSDGDALERQLRIERGMRVDVLRIRALMEHPRTELRFEHGNRRR